MPGIATIHEFLHAAHVPYTVVPHRAAFTAREEAAATHVPGRDWAKVVACFEGELQRLFPDCEVGAMPPLGPLYGHTVFVDAMLALEPEIVSNAGTHREAIAMRWNDFVKMVNPIVGRFAE